MSSLEQKNLRVLNRDVIKYIATFTMVLNHIGIVFLMPGTFLRELLVDIGYFTAPVMCYFLVEGYYHTHSRICYAADCFCLQFWRRYRIHWCFRRRY